MQARSKGIRRRQLLGGIAAGAALGPTGLAMAGQANLPSLPGNRNPSELARDEAFWSEVAGFYDRTGGIVNLEHGYWGKMARPVQDAYINATRMVNTQNSFYARKHYTSAAAESVRRVASALGVHPDEIVLTRNATEAIDNLIRQYKGIDEGDAVLYADIDYPEFKKTIRWLAPGRGARMVELVIPPRANQDQVFELYRDSFDANPDLKLMLIMHVSNQHGLTVPVARIAREARKRGIDVICDSAQSWGLLDFKVPSLEVDWIGFNLHKWIGAPLGVGALYMRRGSLEKISPYPGEHDPENTNAASRVHMGTTNFAATLTIPTALDFHEAIGPANKEARLRYLRQQWTPQAEAMDHIEVLGGLDEPSWSGMASFRLRGQAGEDEVKALQLRLEKEFGIFTVVRDGLASVYCIRITPQVFTTPAEMALLVDSLGKLA